MTEVRLNSTIRNAPKVVVKIYRLIEPIPYAVPPPGRQNKAFPTAAQGPFGYLWPVGSMAPPKGHLRIVYTRFTKWPSRGKAVENASKKVNPAARFAALWLPDHDPRPTRFRYG
jgi:hypothetical protein